MDWCHSGSVVHRPHGRLDEIYHIKITDPKGNKSQLERLIQGYMTGSLLKICIQCILTGGSEFTRPAGE